MDSGKMCSSERCGKGKMGSNERYRKGKMWRRERWSGERCGGGKDVESVKVWRKGTSGERKNGEKQTNTGKHCESPVLLSGVCGCVFKSYG